MVFARKRISNPCEIDRTDSLETGHDAHVAATLLVEFAGEADRIGGSTGFRHLVDDTFGESGRRRLVAGGVGSGHELRPATAIPTMRRFSCRAWEPRERMLRSQ